jgi:hypothetical protein
MRGWTHTVYERIERRATKSVPCSVCGKKVRRSKTFMNTINPWNVNEDGVPRTHDEIWAHLIDLATAWEGEPETHPACKP